MDEATLQAIEVKLTALQFVLEIVIANAYGPGRAEECEAFAKRLADHAAATPPYLPRGASPMDAAELQRIGVAANNEVQRIFRNAIERIRRPGAN